MNQDFTSIIESVNNVPQKLFRIKQILLTAALHVPQGYIKMKQVEQSVMNEIEEAFNHDKDK